MYVSGEKEKLVYSVIVKSTGNLIIADLRPLPNPSSITYASSGQKLSKAALSRCLEAISFYEQIKNRHSTFISRAESYDPKAEDNKKVSLGVFVKRESRSGEAIILLSPLADRDDYILYSAHCGHCVIKQGEFSDRYLCNPDNETGNMLLIQHLLLFKREYQGYNVIVFPVSFAPFSYFKSHVFYRILVDVLNSSEACREIISAGRFATLIQEIQENKASHPESPVLTAFIKGALTTS